MIKIPHHAFQFAFRQLAVRNRDARFWQQFGEAIILVLNRIDFVVQIVGLPAAF